MHGDWKKTGGILVFFGGITHAARGLLEWPTHSANRWLCLWKHKAFLQTKISIAIAETRDLLVINSILTDSSHCTLRLHTRTWGIPGVTLQMSRNDQMPAESISLSSINFRGTLNNANPYNDCLSKSDTLLTVRD